MCGGLWPRGGWLIGAGAARGHGWCGDGAEEGSRGPAFFYEVVGVERLAERGEGVAAEGEDAESGDFEIGPAPSLDVVRCGPGDELGKVAAGSLGEGVDVEAGIGEEGEQVLVSSVEQLYVVQQHPSKIRIVIGLSIVLFAKNTVFIASFVSNVAIDSNIRYTGIKEA